MKMTRRPQPFALLLLALALALGPSLRGEEKPSTPPAEKKTDETKPAPTDTQTTTADDKAASTVEKVEQKAEELADKIVEKVDEKTNPADQKKGKTHKSHGPGSHRGGHVEGPQLGDHTVPAGSKSNNEAVSIFGTTTVDGDIDGEAVSIFGATVINGSVSQEGVAVFGPMTVNGHVGSDVVVVFGDLKLGPKAVVDGDISVVFGDFTREPGAQVGGQTNHVSFGPFNAYLSKCLLRGRLLGFGEGLAWPWLVAAGFLLFYSLIALLFPRGLEHAVETLEQRPGGTVLAAFLTMLLTPILSVLLAVTGIGIALIPFIGLAMFVGTLFGKAAIHAWLGRRFMKLIGREV
ncbi:MAG TPA: hypothetical protein VFJ90_16780, partial [Candidatus Didemnitutus sp.]|nr:hypothetical protein [Candidatus Didemnitutus sp.]